MGESSGSWADSWSDRLRMEYSGRFLESCEDILGSRSHGGCLGSCAQATQEYTVDNGWIWNLGMKVGPDEGGEKLGFMVCDCNRGHDFSLEYGQFGSCSLAILHAIMLFID